MAEAEVKANSPPGLLAKLNAFADSRSKLDSLPKSPTRVCLKDAITPKDDLSIEVYIAARCENDNNLGFRAGIGIYFGPENLFNVSEALLGNQTTEKAELIVTRRAIAIAKSLRRKQITLYTESHFLLIVGTQWLYVGQAAGVLLVSEEEDQSAYIHQFNPLIAECRNLKLSWVWLPNPSINPGLRRAIQFAENGKNRCPWQKSS